MKRMFTCTALAGALVLGGCASLSESQCLASDWRTIGYRDGANGTPSTALLRHQNACMKHGVTPERSAYMAGWHQGVDQFCQPGNGFVLGQRGADYSNVCPAGLEADFHDAYQDGRRLYRAQSEIAAIEQDIGARERRLDEIDAELAAIASGMLEEDVELSDRAAMVVEARNLGREQGKLENELEALTAERAVKVERLAVLRGELVAY